MSTKVEPKINRRDFLKASGGVFAVAAIGSKIHTPTLRKKKFFNNKTRRITSTKYGVCRMCQQQYCSLKAQIQDDVVTMVEGVSGSLLSNGCLCARGNSAIPQHYNPYRMKSPLRRTNPIKGFDVDPGWEEISWEEALTIVAGRLKKIRGEDPRKFAYNQGFSRTGIFIGDTDYMRAFGSPNDFRSNGPLCALHFAPASTIGTFLGPNFDFAHTNYCLNIGRNMGPSTGVSGGGSRGDGGIGVRYFMYAMDRGMKLVCVDPRCAPEASHPNGSWIPILPGTELALVLAITHVLMHELKVYDVEFLTWRTNAPYLVTETGLYLKNEDGKPLIFDNEDQQFKTFDDPTLTQPALNGTFTADGKPVKPAFEYLLASAATNTPEWASGICEISAETIRKLAQDLAENALIGSTIKIDDMVLPYRPVAVIVGRGAVSHKRGVLCNLAAINLNMILGSVGVPGGVQSDGYGAHFVPNEKDGLVTLVSEAVPWWATNRQFNYPPTRVDLKDFYPVSHHMPHIAFKAISNPSKYKLDYSIDTLLVYGGNSIQHNCAPDHVIESFKQIPFVVSISYHMDEPAWLSDIILPEDSNLERYIAGRAYRDVSLKDGKPVAFEQTNIQSPVVPRLFDTRQPDDIFIEIAERAGFLYGEKGVFDVINRAFKDEYKLDINKKYTIGELLDRQVKSTWGDASGIEENVPYFQKVVPFKQRYGYTYFPGKDTRHRVYFEHLLQVGLTLKDKLNENGLETVPGWEGKKFFEYYIPVPKWFDDQDANLSDSEYPYRVINWKTPQFLGLVGGSDNPWLYEVSRNFDPYTFGICINPATAKKLGLKSGDEVVVESRYGSTQGRLIFTETIHPICVGIAGNLGRKSPGLNPIAKEGPNYNQLLTGDEGKIDPIAGQIPISEWVRIRKV
jgi:anaerobic selenocysteine-containing dehydrogenase